MKNKFDYILDNIDKTFSLSKGYEILNQEMLNELVKKTLENEGDLERIRKILTDIIDKYVTENNKN